MEREDWDCSRIVDSFTTGTGKYEDAIDDFIDEDESKNYTEMDDYLLNMGPIGSSLGQSKNCKGFGTNVFNVKCTNSSDGITGTPSELALKLSREMNSYLPKRRRILETEINDELTKIFDEKCETESENVYEINYKRSECPGALDGVDEADEHDDESLEYRCPGTMDILSGRMVPCSVAPTLREIALGRRMRRTVVDAPECLSADDIKKRDECRCKKNNKGTITATKNIDKFHPKIESCCTRKKPSAKQKRCVTFDT